MSGRFSVAAVVIGGMIGACLAASPACAQELGFTPVPVIKGVKSPSPDFTVKDLDGKPFNFGAESTRLAHVLVFWSIFCEPCREEMPVIQRIADEYKIAGTLGVLAVNMDGQPFIDGIKGFFKQYKYNVPVILDELDAKGEQFAIADPFRVAGTPMIYLVDAKGKIAGSHLGRISEADLRTMITGMFTAK